MAGEAGTAAVIGTSGGSGGGGLAASVPGGTRTLVIGGAAIAAMALVFITQRSGGSSGDGEAEGSGNRLDPAANIALGQVAYEQRAAEGAASIRDAEMATTLSTILDSLEIGFDRVGGRILAAESRVQSGILSSESRVQSGIVSSESRVQSGIVSSESRIQNGILSAESRVQSGIVSSESRIQNGMLGLEQRAIQRGQQTYGAAPPFALDSPRDGGRLSLVDVAATPAITGR